MGQKVTVVGVVEDFNMRSIMFDHKIPPCVIWHIPQENYQYAGINVKSSALEANREIEAIWYELFPQDLYTGFLQVKVMEDARITNNVMININITMALISISISILGLYTLISLTVQRRSKEFGVRKVLGASNNVIVNLLGKEMYAILGIACILGIGGGAYVTDFVFDMIFAYHIDIQLQHFVWPVMTILVIVCIAVGFKVFSDRQTKPYPPIEI